MDAESSLSQVAPPIFDGESYNLGAVKMESYLEALDLWDAVEEDYEVHLLLENPTMTQISHHKERKTNKFHTTNIAKWNSLRKGFPISMRIGYQDSSKPSAKVFWLLDSMKTPQALTLGLPMPPFTLTLEQEVKIEELRRRNLMDEENVDTEVERILKSIDDRNVMDLVKIS
ncbi:hypothetical protein L6164_037332 [Bauhinia variegata]|uniref:Uncharacterized protein n=1 Tax=Bauhinia variegata TaxID=167791 RepID=A0ACB9KJP6_BAUVA|nr:hypothetical protein L6164_037332 [Bauhinia variegata]